ncbi:MAG: hypothetical protein AB7E70_20085 [Hyphomicrobiaceae bacterium]
MKRSIFVALAAALAMGFVTATPAEAGKRTYSKAHKAKVAKRSYPRHRHYRGKRTRVLGFSRRVGGYSYSYPDSLLSFDNRRILRDRDPYFDRQAGPFDSGFFFDSGSQPRGGDSPYMN